MVPTGPEAFTLDPSFRGGFAFEQIQGPPRRRQSDHCPGPQVLGDHLSDAEEQLDLRGLSELRAGQIVTQATNTKRLITKETLFWSRHLS